MALRGGNRPIIACRGASRHPGSARLAALVPRAAHFMMRLATSAASLIALLALSGAVRAQSAPRKPALVVLITIDQFRADYLERFGPQMKGGIARLMRGGASFTNAHHDHAITETAPGHATLLSGRFPRSTHIMMNSIGVADDAAPLLDAGYGTGASPKRFIGTTLADWLHDADPRSQALSVSMKDRAAILPIGRSKSEVYWYSPDGRFLTSKYYRDALPGWVLAFNDRMLPQSYGGKSWTLLLPDSAYHEADSVTAEAGGADFTFPHPLPAGEADAANEVRGTPFMDDLVVAFALQGVSSLQLGAGPRTDLLAVSLSATDVIGHRFGPDSREIHDQVLRVDRAIGVLLDSLYKLRDSTTITVAFTSDHGVGTIPELAPANMQPRPLRVELRSLLTPIRAGMAKAGMDTLTIDIEQNLVFIDRRAFKAAKVNADSVLDVFAKALRAAPGVARVDRFSKLPADSARDPIARRWAHQFPPTVPIELIVTLTPLSTFGGNVASHGSPYDYDSGVPLIFYGDGVKPGRITDFVRTVDLAPTLAAIAGVKPSERLDGVVLTKALR
jgi:predicted AlkP superfamily pyrophosphatase or phosphodiesterase